MKIVFTGGGTGGHFTPIIAVAEKVNEIIDREKIIGAKLYYFSDDPFDKEVLFQNGLIYQEIKAGKMRTYFSIKNFFDIFKAILGFFQALFKLFSIYPDVVFGKGGYASFPTILAARFLSIPVIIHESDSYPGRVNLWAGKFANKIALSFKESAQFFPNEKIAWTGQPIRREVEIKSDKDKGLDYFNLQADLPVILVLGGSQGAEIINNVILEALPQLLEKYQIIHQTGINNFKVVQGRAGVILTDNPNKDRYKPMTFLNSLALKNAAGAANLIISRAGSTIFEIAAWGVPSIIIPITKTNGNHQAKNAFAYARAGACHVMEEANLTGNILYSEVLRILEDKNNWTNMATRAKAFHRPDAAQKIAEEIIRTALSHEK